MSYPNEPDQILTPWEAEELAAELHKVDETFWASLAEFLTGTSRTAGILAFANPLESPPPRPTPPKQPLHFGEVIDRYASVLFDTEADFYPNGERLEQWLSELAQKCCSRVMVGIRSVEAAGRPWKTLEHHGLTDAQMREIAEKSAMSRVDYWIKKKRTPEPEKADQTKSGGVIPRSTVPFAKPSTEPMDLAQQLRTLAEESRRTNEQIADGVSLNLRTFYRHLSGDVIPGKQTILRYEQFFLKALGRKVRLDVPSRRH